MNHRPGHSDIVRQVLRFSFALALLILVARLAIGAPSYPEVIRIGYQKGNSLVILKANGELEKTLAPLHVKVEWHEFAYGPPMIEALAAGDIDLGFVGATPPVFAQAGGAPNLVYVGYAAPYGTNYGVVVPAKSEARTFADLKGQRIAVAEGSAGEYLLLKALENAGLAPADVRITYLQYSEARAAIERGDVAAWVVPDPRLADVETNAGMRAITTAANLPAQYSFYVSPRAFAEKYPAVLRSVLELVDATEHHAQTHIDETAAFLEKDTRVPAAVWQIALKRNPWGVSAPLTPEVIAAQQEVADTFARYHLIPRPVHVADAVVRIP